MDTSLFLQMLQIDSTSGREGEFADFLVERLATSACRVEKFPVESMTVDCLEGCPRPYNILFSWGTPKVVFCSHLDTVPPYIAPTCHNEVQTDCGCNDSAIIYGRGACDAKGQIFAMYEACLELERRGHTDFGLLLLAGEETGSFGAKAFNSMTDKPFLTDDVVVVVGEPTDNFMASAAKGTKSFEVEFEGEAFH